MLVKCVFLLFNTFESLQGFLPVGVEVFVLGHTLTQAHALYVGDEQLYLIVG